MITARDKQLAAQAAEELDYHGEQLSAPAQISNVGNLSSPQAEVGVPPDAGLPELAKPFHTVPTPAVSLSGQLDNLRKHLRQAHQLVGRELYAIVEGKLARPITATDLSALKTGLLRIDNEVHEIQQMVQALQMELALRSL